MYNNTIMLTSGSKSMGMTKYKNNNIYYYRKWNTGETVYKPYDLKDEYVPEFKTLDEAKRYIDDYEKLLRETMKKFNKGVK